MIRLARAQRNDEIRRNLEFAAGGGSQLVQTAGVQGLGEDALYDLVKQFINFDDFAPDVDYPAGERDFGALKWNGQEVWFKMDQSEDDPNHRVVTFLLPEEY